MSQESRNAGNADNLVKMANQIARFFESQPDRNEAIAGVLGHIQRFWEPRMRQAIAAYARSGGTGLREIAAEAVSRLD